MDIPAETRRESYEQISLLTEQRKKLILDTLLEHGEMTAQEIATLLYKRGLIPSDERNFTAPRLTELRKGKKVKPSGKKTCKKTGRSVTVWAAGKEED